MDDNYGPMMDGKLYPAHASHFKDHELRFHIKAPESDYECHGCKMPGDSNPCLKCPYENCSVYFHQLCYRLDPYDPEYQHIFFSQCVFKFYNDILSDISDQCGDFPYCDACGEDIKGFRYRCIPYDVDSHPPGNHDLHPTCLNHKLKMTLNSRVELELKDRVKSKCLGCKKRYPVEECIGFTGWKWVSKKRVYWGFPYCFTGTKFCYHLNCMNDKLRQQFK